MAASIFAVMSSAAPGEERTVVRRFPYTTVFYRPQASVATFHFSYEWLLCTALDALPPNPDWNCSLGPWIARTWPPIGKSVEGCTDRRGLDIGRGEKLPTLDCVIHRVPGLGGSDDKQALPM